MSKELGRPVSNRNKVPVRQWRKWSRLAQKVFNNVFESMRPSRQFAFHHPDAKLLPAEHWKTVRWNAAWIAASAANGEGSLGDVIDV